MTRWRSEERDRVVSQGVLLLVMRGAAVAATAVGIRVITELLEPRTFGEFRLVLGIATLLSATGLLPLVRYAARYLHDAELQGRARRFVSAARRSIFGVGLAAMALLVAGSVLVSVAAPDVRFVALGLSAGLVAIAQGRWSLELFVLATRGRVIASGAYELAKSLVVPIAVALAAATLGQSVAALTLAQSAAIALLAAAATLAYRGKGGDSATAWIRASRSFAAPLALVGALSWIFNLGDRYLLALLASPADVGRYAAAYGIAATGVAAVGGVVPTLMMKPMYRAAAGADRVRRSRAAARAFIGQSAIVLAAVTVLFVAAPLLSQLLLAPEFREGAVAVMRWVGLGQGFVVIAQALDLDSYSRARTRPIAVSYAAAAALNVALNLALVPIAGILGAAVATACSGAAYMAAMMIQLRPFRAVWG